MIQARNGQVGEVSLRFLQVVDCNRAAVAHSMLRIIKSEARTQMQRRETKLIYNKRSTKIFFPKNKVLLREVTRGKIPIESSGDNKVTN